MREANPGARQRDDDCPKSFASLHAKSYDHETKKQSSRGVIEIIAATSPPFLKDPPPNFCFPLFFMRMSRQKKFAETPRLRYSGLKTYPTQFLVSLSLYDPRQMLR